MRNPPAQAACALSQTHFLAASVVAAGLDPRWGFCDTSRRIAGLLRQRTWPHEVLFYASPYWPFGSHDRPGLLWALLGRIAGRPERRLDPVQPAHQIAVRSARARGGRG